MGSLGFRNGYARNYEANMTTRATPLTAHAGIEVPLICGAMYPCSNPELVAAASEAGGIGIVQPVSLTYVHGYDFREGLRHMRRLTDKPLGMNALIEKASKKYHERMTEWIDIALEEGVRFFVTSLGKPRWVVDRVEPHGGVVYHDVTERKWALKGLESGVHGLIAVNRRGGGACGSPQRGRTTGRGGRPGGPGRVRGGGGDTARIRAGAGTRLRGRAAGDPVHRHARMHRLGRLQARHPGGRRGRRGAVRRG